MTVLLERPFFVVGNPRSGTTLLRLILSSHPRLYIPSETGFVPFLGFDSDTDLVLGQVRSILDRISKLNREWAGLVSDADALWRSLPKPTLGNLLDALYRVKIAGQDAERWGDKTPSYALYIPRLSRIFPTAQFIHLIRDGRDATLSAQQRWGAEHWYMDKYYLLRNWTEHVENGRAAGHALGTDRYMEVRYEDLVGQPEAVVWEICAFLGELYYPMMLQHTQLAREPIRHAGHAETLEPISTASVGRWRTQMSDFDKRMADQVAGPTLTACGYELACLGPPGVPERIRFLLLAAKYVPIHGARQTLRSLGLLTLNRDKRSR